MATKRARMRELMRSRAAERIKSPLAKVDEVNGTVSCVICGPVGAASVALFNQHLVTNTHIHALKQLQAQATALKRQKEAEAVKTKEIVEEESEEEEEVQPVAEEPIPEPKPRVSTTVTTDSVPISFFDNPKEAEKVRGVVNEPLLADPVLFDKEMAVFEESLSHDLAKVEQHTDETYMENVVKRDEEEANETRNLIGDLESLSNRKRRFDAEQHTASKKVREEEEEEVDDDDLEAFLTGDWRAKAV